MHPHRKLLVLAINELLHRNLITLEPKEVASGHVNCTLAGRPSVVNWHEINCDELRISAWWDYDHSQHPQANLDGNRREQFQHSLPLAKPQYFPKIIAAAVSGWLERRTGRFLQGQGTEGLFDIYTRRGESKALNALPAPAPFGFAAEGKYFP